MPKEFGSSGPRAIYPDAAQSRNLAKCSLEAQLLFDRLIAQADDQGRLEGDAVIIKALCLPLVSTMTPRKVGAFLAELAAHRLVLLYGTEEFPNLVQLVTWWTWQAGQRRAYPSRWPAPPEWNDPIYGHKGTGPKTYREAVGLDPYERPKTPESPHDADFNSAQSPHGAEFLPTSSPHDAESNPHGAVLPRAGLGAPAPAGPQPLPRAGAGAGAGANEEIPPPPAERGRRSEGTAPRQVGDNPRATGDNPRANGTSPRDIRQDQKTGPTALADVMRRIAERPADDDAPAPDPFA